MAESLGFKGTLKLKPGSVPTIVKPGPSVRHEKQDRHSTQQLLEKRKKAQMKLPHDDSNDRDYIIDSEESECDSVEQVILTPEQLYIKENKYLVFESAFETLVKMLKCNLCGCPVDPNDTIKDLTGSTVLTLNIFCTCGHLITKWSSQLFVGKMPVGNLRVSAATLFSGQTFTHLSQFSEFLNMKFISHTTFNKIQRDCLMPVVKHTWSLLQKADLDKIKQGTSFRLAGDGRCDSPGFSAKYCTYSLLDIETQHIVMFVVVKVTETGSSSKVEVEGFRTCMTYLLDQRFTIDVLETDRHGQIRSIMKKVFSNVDHQFDVWHLCKSLKKKLTGKAKSKGCEDLNFWIKAICNHLWWCASNCEGDKVLLEENVAAKKKWLVRESKAHKALKEVVLDKRPRKDICQLSEFCHTGNLEVYHSLMLKYCPKRQEFDYDQMVTRTTLAVIDHNLNQNRDHKINKNGEKAYKLVCPKATGQWVVKPVFKNKTYQWVYAIMENVLVQKDTCASSTKKAE
ncbi:unnamed protein product [Mytilus edulis]|uniref:Uncharacterized protein n=1 Tax=Mytilus edulis TaxID=6550 RepID=A0A8S3PUG1_MYTED|nr:unnamed protein product [Mytilus edulis]